MAEDEYVGGDVCEQNVKGQRGSNQNGPADQHAQNGANDEHRAGKKSNSEPRVERKPSWGAWLSTNLVTIDTLITLICTIFVAGFTGALLLVSYFQHNQTQHSLRLTADALRETRRANQLASQALMLERQERAAAEKEVAPIVVVHSFDQSPDPPHLDTPTDLRVVVMNVGRHPAMSISMRANWFVSEPGQFGRPSSQIDVFDATRNLLVHKRIPFMEPEGDYEFTMRLPALQQPILAEIVSRSRSTRRQLAIALGIASRDAVSQHSRPVTSWFCFRYILKQEAAFLPLREGFNLEVGDCGYGGRDAVRKAPSIPKEPDR